MSDYIVKPIDGRTKEILAFLSDRRKSLGISVRALAATMGVYPNQIQQWLNLPGNPQMDNLVRLGNALGIRFSMSNTKKYADSAEELVGLLDKAKTYYELSTRDIAEMTGIVQPSVANIIGHRVMPRLNTFILLADALGVELELYTED